MIEVDANRRLGTHGAATPLDADESEVVRALRASGALSRTDLARITGYSRPKMTAVVGGLIDRGILEEVGVGASAGGRRPRLLNFNSQHGCVVGIDVGATSIDLALADLSGKIIERQSAAADVRDGPDAVLGQICQLVAAMAERSGRAVQQVYAVGIGVPGPVQFSTGLLIAPPLMPSWNGFPIRATIRQTFPAANVIVDNDVNVMALGELRAGAGQSIENFIFVKIGTGIGAGIVCHGAVYRGSDGCAGDIGHICADHSGPVCRCGNVGCLEAIAAGPPIAARGLLAAQNGKSPALAARLNANSGSLSALDVGAAAAAGDAVAMEIIQSSGRMIGEVLASLVNFFNPRLILVGGGVSNIGHQLLSSIRQAVLRRSLPLSTNNLRIDYASLGSDAGIHGALALALEHVFEAEGF